MIGLSRICLLGCLLVLLTNCGSWYDARLEPVRAGSGGTGSFEREITTNTNCAEIGETVTFIITIANRTNGPLTLTGTPLMDLTLQPSKWLRSGAKPIERWSETDQYPVTINPILAPEERRSYTWKWIANTRFTQQGPSDNMVLITLMIGAIHQGAIPYTPAGSTEAFMGVGTFSNGDGRWPCAKLRQ